MFPNGENGNDSSKPYIFLAEKTGFFFCRCLKSFLALLLLASFVVFAFYLDFSSPPQWQCPKCLYPVPLPETTTTHPPSPSGHLPEHKTNISHIVFGIGGSVRTWPKRRRYSDLWWSPGQTRGFVWLDEKPPGGDSSWPAGSIPYRVSEDTSRFRDMGRRSSAVRMARIVAESVGLGLEGVRWYVMGDDDTVFFRENLVEVLGRYDHEEYRYVGGVSESVEQDVMHSYGMAFGGGGFAISSGLARELARALDGCLDRYAAFYGSDQRVHACLAEFGVPLTKEPGFHQVDLRGDAYGMLAAHPVAPIVSLHHLDYVKPLIPSLSQLDALSRILGASRLDPPRSLQQTFCYDARSNWSVSVSWGYTAQIYPWILTPKELQTPLRTFRTWRTHQPQPFTFNTRPWNRNACENPLVYFLDGADDDVGGCETSTVYSLHRRSEPPGSECSRAGFKTALKVDKVRVFAAKMGTGEANKAPRRQCCDLLLQGNSGGIESDSLHVRIRKCRIGETLSPP